MSSQVTVARLRLSVAPRFIRLRDAPLFFGMDKNRFNREVRPHLTEIRIGKQGRAFDRLEMETAAEEYKHRNGRPAAQPTRKRPWETKGPPGLTKRGGVWHIDKQFRGARICESTGTSDIRQAEEYLARRVVELRETKLYGARELRSFRAAATKYLQEYHHKKRIKDDALHLRQLDPFIGGLEPKQVHMGSLQDFIAKR